MSLEADGLAVPTDAIADGAPSERAVAAVMRSTACIALIRRDGLVAVLSRRLTRDLGFDSPEDLRGLQLGSFWHPSDRATVARAFAAALRGRAEAADVDLSYASPEAGRARVTFRPGPDDGAVLMMLDCAPPPATEAQAPA